MSRIPLVILLVAVAMVPLSWVLLRGETVPDPPAVDGAASSESSQTGVGGRAIVEPRDIANRVVAGVQTSDAPESPRVSDERPRLSGLTPVQRADMVKNCLLPRIQEVAAAHQGEKYRTLVEKIPGASPHYQELVGLAREIDALNLAYVLEKESAIVEAFSTGVGVVDPGTEIESTPGVHGQVMWGAPPSDVWGNKGAAVAVRFSLLFDAYPRLLEALKQLSSKQKEFDVLLSRKG